MATKQRTGAAPESDDARRNDRFGRQISFSDIATSTAEQARLLVDQLEANGARLSYRAGDGELMPSFTYELMPSGDRQRCRSLIAQAKAQPLLWAAVLAEIARQSRATA